LEEERGMQNLDQFYLADLPMWRKILLACAIGSFFFFGGKLFNKEADIYISAPSVPVAKTKQVYPVLVNHGYVRYLTRKEADDWTSGERELRQSLRPR
jgi:hypothetical protein